MKKLRTNIYAASLMQSALIILLLWLSHFAFTIHNADLLGHPSASRVFFLAAAGLNFDLCVFAYVNALFIILRFLPFEFTIKTVWRRITSTLFFITNSVMLIVAYADIPYFRFSGTHLHFSGLQEMLSDPNIAGIVLSYAAQYWWTFLMIAALIAAVWVISYRIVPVRPAYVRSEGKIRTTLRILTFIAAVGVTFLCMRGRIESGRPLSIADAVWSVEKAPEINIVLNTPFCLVRSFGDSNRIETLRFYTDDELAKMRTSIHYPDSAKPFTRKNIVIITIESGSSHFSKYLSPVADAPGVDHVMPFLDSIAAHSLICRHLYATGVKSSQGIAAIYGGFPLFGEKLYFPSPYIGNTLDSPAHLLARHGYDSRFYFGGAHGSFNIDQFLKTVGFKEVTDRSMIQAHFEAMGLKETDDGVWGAYDHLTGEYAATDMSRLSQPFIAGWFTIQNHSPFSVPLTWHTDSYRHPAGTTYRSAEYTDRALRHFFDTAKRQPWCRNTIFIVTGDHGCRDLAGTVYDNEEIQPQIPFVCYTPDGSIAPGEIDAYMSQFDIAPTILGLVGFPDPYVAVGRDILAAGSGGNFGFGFLGNTYRIFGPEGMVALDPTMLRIEKATRSITDGDADRMVRWARALMQDYTWRINSDCLWLGAE